MTTDDIRKLLRAEPFRPFRLHLVTGRALSIPHPEFAFSPPNNKRVVYVSDHLGHVDVVNATIVVSMDFEDERGGSSGAAPSPNGVHP